MILVATGRSVWRIDPRTGAVEEGAGLDGLRPTCLAADARRPGRAWCGSAADGVARSDDGGRSWRPAGLAGEQVTAVAVAPVSPGRVWAGTEPSALWSSADGGASWQPAPRLLDLSSAPQWSFPPRPETHHVRWIACHPSDAGRLWVAIEAGALVTTTDGGESWRDRVPGGPYDTHELAVHPGRPERLRVSAGDGYFESGDGGAGWRSPERGLEVGYLRSVAIDPGDPEVVLLSGASGPGSTYLAGRSDGRLYRRAGTETWRRVVDGWPDPPATIAPLLVAGRVPGELWAADERGVHRSTDGGRGWRRVATFASSPANIRGLALVGTGG